jgi:hypothetical protein
MSELPTMPKRVIEIHDSVLEGISVSQDEAQLQFSLVYIHQGEGTPGHDAGQVWTQPAVIRIAQPKVSGAFSQFPVRLSEGSTVLGKTFLDNEIPVPLRYEGRFELRLTAFRHESEVVIVTGSGAQLELTGEAEYLEEFRP